ncbi:MAG TPA: aromatic ring-hydroxylating dioxygenase subunit alpha, partial [Croceicoccus sp.]|nr:aromatic ring-hydroxylating dioxygenase subunit alpha [Croceicoccus sp.]
HYAAGTTDQAPDISDLPVAAYLDEDRFKREFEAIFLRRPQGILLSIEVPEPGDYVARTYLGKPLLVVRGKDGVARVFLNVCRHRGARVCAEGSGSAARFTCPYHAWTYDREGRLIGVSGASTFGEMDKATLGLTELSSQEAAGVIWATLTPGVDTDIDAWLGTMRHQLELLRLRECVVFSQRTIPSPGWKVTMDGYLEAYHHDTVHADTLSKHTIGNLLVHDIHGHHQILTMARRNLPELAELPEAEWQASNYLRRIYCVFPNFQVSGIVGGYFLISQILPGDCATKSVTIQTILTARKPETSEELAAAEAFRDMAYNAVEVEDYPIGFGIQAGLASGANEHFVIGRNEPGLRHYHQTVAALSA